MFEERIGTLNRLRTGGRLNEPEGIGIGGAQGDTHPREKTKKPRKKGGEGKGDDFRLGPGFSSVKRCFIAAKRTGVLGREELIFMLIKKEYI